MTFRAPKYGPGDVRPFNGTKAETAKNKLSHRWQQVPNPMKPIQIPAEWLEALKAKGVDTDVVHKETVGKCAECGAMDMSEKANWPCGEALLLGPGEYVY